MLKREAKLLFFPELEAAFVFNLTYDRINTELDKQKLNVIGIIKKRR